MKSKTRTEYEEAHRLYRFALRGNDGKSSLEAFHDNRIIFETLGIHYSKYAARVRANYWNSAYNYRLPQRPPRDAQCFWNQFDADQKKRMAGFNSPHPNLRAYRQSVRQYYANPQGFGIFK